MSLTKILKEGSLKAIIESECIDEELKNNNFNEDDTFDMYDATVTPSSKFILSLTDPDFTAYKVSMVVMPLLDNQNYHSLNHANEL